MTTQPNTPEPGERGSRSFQHEIAPNLIGCLRVPSLTVAARIYPTQWRLPSAISEAELLHGYSGAAPWSSEAR